MKILNAIWCYLKDWKNILTHGMIGVLILLVALVIPVAPIYRVCILVVVVVFNIIRMKHNKKYLQKAD